MRRLTLPQLLCHLPGVMFTNAMHREFSQMVDGVQWNGSLRAVSLASAHSEAGTHLETDTAKWNVLHPAQAPHGYLHQCKCSHDQCFYSAITCGTPHLQMSAINACRWHPRIILLFHVRPGLPIPNMVSVDAEQRWTNKCGVQDTLLSSRPTLCSL